MADKKRAVVLFDAYNWMHEDGRARSAAKGDEIEVSAEEFERGVDMGGLAGPKSKAAKEASEESPGAADVPVPEAVEDAKREVAQQQASETRTASQRK